METKGFIRNISEVEPHTGSPGHRNMAGYRFVRPGPDGSMCLGVGMDVLESTIGIIDPHTHDDLFDHAFYVVAGTVAVKLGDGEERVVGEGTFVYCPSNVSHAFRNLGATEARILAISARPK